MQVAHTQVLRRYGFSYKLTILIFFFFLPRSPGTWSRDLLFRAAHHPQVVWLLPHCLHHQGPSPCSHSWPQGFALRTLKEPFSPHTLLLSSQGDPNAEALTNPAEQTQVPDVAFRLQSRAHYLDQEGIKLLTHLLGQADRNNGLQKIPHLRLNASKPSQSPKMPQQAKKCGENMAAVEVKRTDCI